MPILLLLLAAGVFAYFFWRARTSSFTRDCRWRQHKKEHKWTCVYCGAVSRSDIAPTQCLKGNNE